MYDITIYVAVIIAICLRVYLMRGSFVLPTFYMLGDQPSFNLGSLTSVIVGVIAAIALMQAQPDLFANWYVAAITAYGAPQIADAIVTKGTIIKADQESTSSDEDFEVDYDIDSEEMSDPDFDEEVFDDDFDEEGGA